MEIKGKIKGREITFDAYDILWDAIDSMDDEYDKEEIIKSLGWHDLILKRAREIIEKEFSAECYNPQLHKVREELLKNIKQNEIEFYARSIAGKVEDCKRWHDAWFDMRRFLMDLKYDRNVDIGNIPDCKNIDHDYRKELEGIIKKSLMEKFDSKELT